MKATAPLRPHKDSTTITSTSMRPPHCATITTTPEEEEEDLLCLHHDMNDCYSRLRRLVPTIPPHKKVSRVEILQHVIDYILDLQLALDAQPALWRPVSTRTPLAVLNTEQITTVVNKQEDSILCR
ncbi:DNA-binding protein inhibitor ID-4 [Astyanax mexicanus]|uniref:DNA-binding protein inhibitor ID-4 n=2 Tax=Astyanax mexicanus TaxID=7994 RepID=A0A8B9JNW3_ASTMX|nr:DNA-binding protein inhibitor ID-4 [Astyanax mexicanus]XP_007250510.1 DNA-binding protein inhibitor ID-4 [Astyanax mexicanus]KAG9276545.1 DNA-binding protein inhibitor ID-4 [Astyanax mexicanus]